MSILKGEPQVGANSITFSYFENEYWDFVESSDLTTSSFSGHDRTSREPIPNNADQIILSREVYAVHFYNLNTNTNLGHYTDAVTDSWDFIRLGPSETTLKVPEGATHIALTNDKRSSSPDYMTFTEFQNVQVSYTTSPIMNIKKGTLQVEKSYKGTDLLWKYSTSTPSISYVSRTTSSLTFNITNNDERTVTVYYGTISNPLTNATVMSSGQTLQRTISGLASGTSYTVYARAQGFQSLFSGEVTITQTTDALASYVTNGLLLHLDAGDNNSYPDGGNTWFDLSGNNYDGTLLGGVGFTTEAGGSLDFVNDQDESSGGQIVNLGQPSQLVGRQLPVTIMGFFKPRTFGKFDGIYSIYDDTNNSELVSMVRLDSGNLNYFTTTSSGGFQYDTIGNASLNQWNFFTVTVSGTISSPTIYGRINNTTQTFNFSALSSNPNTNVNPLIGGTQFENGANSTGIEHFDGLIPLIMVYNRALTQTEIDQNFNYYRNRYGL